MPVAGDTSRPGHSRARSASIPLDILLITTAVTSSADAGKTLDFSLKNIGEVTEEATAQLARIGRDDLDDEGIVTRLALSNNYLRKLPSNFASLYRLRYLNLRANAFVTFPEVVTKMPSLEILDIGRNKIQVLPTDPGTLVNLRVFSLSKNRITKLPAYFINFHSLKMLKVDNNPIEWPPASVVQDQIPPTDKTEDMVKFISQLRQWLVVNAPPEPERPERPERRHSPRRSPINGTGEQAKRLVNRYDIKGSATTKRAQRLLTSSQANNTDQARTSFGRAAHGRNISEDSVNSEYSATSEYSLVDNVNYVGEGPGLQIPMKPPLGRSDSAGSPDTSVPALDEALPPAPSSYHGRNASYSADNRRPIASTGNLVTKQSLPDLRKGYSPSGTIKASGRKPREPVTSSFPSLANRQNGASSSASGLASPPLASSFPARAQGETSPPPTATSMDGVRNSYFRRLSKIPLSVSAPSLPQSLCQTIDAIRGILFAVSQIYSAVQQYTNVIVERRIASILVRVLEPAKRAMDTLIGALERYDSTARRAVPSALECRSVVEACRENVSVCGRVVAVLQLQLKVLAAGAGGDVRYTRHLLLMLYGGIAEVVNSWRDLMPHLAEVREFLAGTALPTFSAGRVEVSTKNHGTGLGLSMAPISGPSSTRRPISPIEEHIEPTQSAAIQESESEVEPVPSPAHSAFTNRSRMERRAGSRELTLSTSTGATGKAPTSSPMESPMSAGSDAPVAQSSPVPLRSALRNANMNANANALHAERSAASSPNHSISAQSQSRDERSDAAGSPHMRPGRLARRAQGTLADPSESLRGVDEDLLNTAEKAAATASEMWALLGATIESARSQGVHDNIITPVNSGLNSALEATTKLKAALRAVREGTGRELGRRPLFEVATLFAKSVTRTIALLRTFASSYSIPPKLRATAQRVTQVTQETIFFLQASSFAPPPSARPSTPGFPTGLGLGLGGTNTPMSADPRDGHLRAGLPLPRARSTTVEGISPGASMSGHGPMMGTPRDAPWSAMPGQTFRSAEHSSLIGRTGAQMI